VILQSDDQQIRSACLTRVISNAPFIDVSLTHVAGSWAVPPTATSLRPSIDEIEHGNGFIDSGTQAAC
jgi:hypothetical protein